MLGAIKRVFSGRQERPMVTIGRLPNGDPIEVPEEDLMGSMYDMSSGDVLMAPSRPKGEGVGSKIKRALPSLLDGVAAGASMPSRDGSALDFFGAMGAGMGAARNRNLMDYQMQRQQNDDQMRRQLYESQIMENEAQARNHLARSMQEPNEPAERVPQTWESQLVQMHREAIAAGNIEKANAIADQLNSFKTGSRQSGLHNVGGALYDENNGQWLTPPRQKATQVRGRVWVDTPDAPGFEEEFYDMFDPSDGRAYRQLVQGSRRQKAPSKPAGRSMTPGQQITESRKRAATELLSKAGGDPQKALEEAKRTGAHIDVQTLLANQVRSQRQPVGRTVNKTPSTAKDAFTRFMEGRSAGNRP